MKLQSMAVVASKPFTSEKGISYYDFVDTAEGGLFTLTINGSFEGIKPGQIVNIDVEVMPRKLPGGGVQLAYVAGSVSMNGHKPG